MLFAAEGVLFQYAASISGFGNNLYATNMGATDSQIALNQMIPNIAAVMLMLPMGIISDRQKKAKTVPMFMLCFLGTMYLFYGSVPAMGEYRMVFYFIFMGLTSGFVAAYGAQWQNLFGSVVSASDQNRTYAFRNRFMFIIGTITPLLCGAAMSAMDTVEGKLGVLRMFYYAAGLLMFIQAFIISRLSEPLRLIENEKKFALTDIVVVFTGLSKNKKFLAFFFSIMFFYLGWHIDWTMWYIGQTQYIGFTEAHLSYFSGLASVMQLLGIGLWAKINQKKGIHFSIVFGIAGLALCPIVMLSSLAAVPLGYGVITFMVLGGIANFSQASIAICVIQMLLRTAPQKNRAMVISLYTMAVTLSNSLQPYIGVKLYDALGADKKALIIFNLIVLFWRLLATGLFVIRYKRRKNDLLTA